MSEPRYPLQGLRILDFTRFQQGPFATMLLADLGADVIKVEPPGGELGRRIGGTVDGSLAPYFESYDRNKKSITLKLSHPEAPPIVYRLVRAVDIVVDNFRAGAMADLGFGFEELRCHKPDIVVASATGFGEDGEWARRSSYDIVAQALSGIMSLQGGGPGRPPQPLFAGLADQIGALVLAVGCLAGVIARDTYGTAQHVDVSLFGSLISVQAHHLQRFLLTGVQEQTHKTASPTVGVFCTADDSWISICVVDPAQWPTLCRVLGCPELAEDERFKSGWARMDHRDELEEVLRGVMIQRPRDQWLKDFIAADIPAAPVKDYASLIEERQAFDNDYLVGRNHPALGRVSLVGSPFRFQGLSTGPRDFAPELSQHTEEVLLSLGYTWQEIAKLRASGVTEPWDPNQET